MFPAVGSMRGCWDVQEHRPLDKSKCLQIEETMQSDKIMHFDAIFVS